MNLLDLTLKIGLYAGTASFLGLLLLVPLYIQQARDVRRLREWADLTPDRGTAEFQAAEAAGLAMPAPTPMPARSSAPPGAAGPLTAAERVARDRPAAARITYEHPAVAAPEPWWRRFVLRPDPRYLVAIVGGVLALAVAAVVVSLQLTEDRRPETSKRTPAVVPSEVSVAVLNSTAVPGLADSVGDDLAAGDFQVDAVANSESPFEKSVVMYERGHEAEAEAVAKHLGIDQTRVIEPEIESTVAEASGAAEPASIVVIAGADRTRVSREEGAGI